MAFLQGFGPEGDYIRGRFKDEWVSGGSARTAIAWGNKKFTKPNKEAWVRFSIGHSGAEQASVGDDPLHRHDGMVMIEVFVPLDDGEGAMDDLCDAAGAVFRDHRDQQGLRFRTPSVVNVGPTDTWFKKDVLIPFVRDTVFS